MVSVDSFLGVDFTSTPENCDLRRSTDAPNMIRDTPGKNRKRNGYTLVHNFPGTVHGIHTINVEGKEKFFVHAGTSLYLKEENSYNEVYTGMNDAKSNSVVLNGMLVIIDGLRMLCYDGETVTNMNSKAYVPTTIIGRRPSGGGTLYEPVNMISDFRIEKFKGDGSSKNFYISTGYAEYISYVQQRVNGKWEYLSYDIHFDYTSAKGVVKFFNAPPAPSDGEDNILICYRYANSTYSNIINSCNICTLYGINGAMDRIFITGSEKYPNRDYYCQIDDPTYWGDIWYGSLGKSDRPIMGYSLVAGYLAAHKTDEDSDANIILRTGEIIDDEPCFTIKGTYTSGGAVCNDCYGMLDNEPVYLSAGGICAITPSDVLGERFSQVRSYFLNGKLLKEKEMEKASAVVYNNFYMLLLNNTIYILDGLQSIVSSGEPFSHRQYEGYVWKNIPAVRLFSVGDTLYFGGKNGGLFRFYRDDEQCYSDDGETFESYWETAFYTGSDFSRYKTVTRLAVLLDSDSEKIEAEYKDADGKWLIAAQGEKGRHSLCRKVHIKDCEGVKFRIRDTGNNDFRINKLQFTYINGRNI